MVTTTNYDRKIMEMKNEVLGGKAIKDVFPLLSIFFFYFNGLTQFDRACATYDSESTGGLEGGNKLPREWECATSRLPNLAFSRRSVSWETVRKMAHEKIGEKCGAGRRGRAPVNIEQ